MSRVRAFFLEEAAECLETLRSAGRGSADPARLYAAARRLRGNAQLARYGSLAELAGRVEARLKRVAGGDERWSEEVAADLAGDLHELEQSVQAVRAGRIHQDVRKEMPDDPEAPAGAAELPIEELEYSARDALARALELRATLEDGIVAADPVGPILDELFDLVRLGLR